MRVKSALILGLVAAAFGGAAQAQVMPFEQVVPQAKWTVDVGAGVLYSGRRASGRDGRAQVAPWLGVNYQDRVYADPLDGVGVNLIKGDAVRVGLQIEPQFSAGHPEVAPTLDRPGLGANAGGYAYVRVPGNVVIGGKVGHDIARQSDGWVWRVSAGQQSKTPIGLATTVVYVRGADGQRTRAYYGITPAEAAATGLPVYAPSGGVQAAGAFLLLLAPVGRNLGAGVMFNYERLMGDAKDSPIITKRNDFRAGVLVAKRFSWG